MASVEASRDGFGQIEEMLIECVPSQCLDNGIPCGFRASRIACIISGLRKDNQNQPPSVSDECVVTAVASFADSLDEEACLGLGRAYYDGQTAVCGLYAPGANGMPNETPLRTDEACA